MEKTKQNISVVIPAYNTGRRIISIIRYYKKLKDHINIKEIIVVCDGCTDGGETAIASLKEGAKVICYSKNGGKGFAIKQGILVSKGDWILTSDDDKSTLVEWDKFLDVRSSNDLISTTRYAKGGMFIAKPSFNNMIRKITSRAFLALVHRMTYLDTTDTQNGLWLISSKLAKSWAKSSEINGFAYSVELLCYADSNGYRSAEFPCVFLRTKRSTVKLKHIWQMFNDVLRISGNMSIDLSTQLMRDDRDYD